MMTIPIACRRLHALTVLFPDYEYLARSDHAEYLATSEDRPSSVARTHEES